MSYMDLISSIPLLELRVLIISALPIAELRLGIPFAINFGLNPVKAYILAIIGNLLPVPFLLLFLERIRKIAKRWKLTASIYDRIERRTYRKRKIIDKYGYPGLTLFVAVPLPITGAWTGSLISFLLELNPIKALLFICLGVLIAGIIVTASVLGVLSLVY